MTKVAGRTAHASVELGVSPCRITGARAAKRGTPLARLSGMRAPLARILAAAGVLLALGSPVAAQQATPSLVPQQLRDRAAREGSVRAIVELRLPSAFRPEGTLAGPANLRAQRQEIASRAARLLGTLPRGAYQVRHQYVSVPYLALDLSERALARLDSAGDAVARVMEDEIVRPILAESVPIVQGDQAWASGYDGTGTTIAIVDTGVDGAHPMLSGKVVEEACYSSTVAGTSETVCPNGLDEQLGPGAAVPCSLDDCIHGTHVAGIAAGDGAPAGQPFSGVAKSARLMAVQVFSKIINPLNCGGVAPCAGAFTSDIIAGLERVYSVAAGRPIAAVNMSLGGGLYDAPCDAQPYKPIIDNLRSIGVATVVASGNSGSTTQMSAPACVSSAVSVGATDKQDAVSYFSNVADALSLFAPGEAIVSSVPGGLYQSLSGTSMAAPHVAGAWAVIRQGAPSADVSTVLGALRQTGTPIADTRLFGAATIPRVRIFQALATLAPVVNPAPQISALAPARARAGAGVSLTVSGSGFDAFSVVQWNGAPRPTTVVNMTTLVAAIPAADLGSGGVAQVSVFTPSPGGGTSSSLPFTIDPPASLTPGVLAIGPGSPETVTLANGYGGSSDWLALAQTGAPDSTYITWTWVGTGVTDRTWTVTMPTTAGTYEFRLFVNNARAATSAAVTVDPSLNPIPAVTSLSPVAAVAGGSSFTLTVNGRGFVSGSQVRWNGSARATTFVSAMQLRATVDAADVSAVGTAQVTVFTPAPGGGLSTALSFTIAPPPSLTVSATSVTGASSVTVTLENGLGGSADWLALASSSSANTSYVQYTYVGAGVTTRTWTVTMPATAGTYEFRLFLNNTYTRAATSAPITVLPPTTTPSLTVSATEVQGGTNVTVSLADGYGGSGDWLAFAATSASNTSYAQFTYVGTGITTRTWTVTTPLAGGTYEFRLFVNNTYTRVATSPTISVTPGPNPTPVLTSLSPPRGLVGSTSLTVAAIGSGFVPTSVIQWNGVARATTYVSGTEVRTTLAAADLATLGTTLVAVVSPSPGGGSSAALQFTVVPPPVLTVDATSVRTGAAVTVTLTGGLGGATDWLGLAATGAPNTSYLQYTYVGKGVTTRTWTVTMPSTAGTYEFRLFLNNTYTIAAVSPAVTVKP